VVWGRNLSTLVERHSNEASSYLALSRPEN
jgi:hypothetical protein